MGRDKYTIQVKKVSEKSLDEFYNLFSSGISTQFPEYSSSQKKFFLKKHSKKKYTQLASDKNRLLLGAWIGKQLVGLMDIVMPVGGISFGIWLLVDPQFQKKGIGMKLLQTWEEKVKRKGAHGLYLYSPQRNVLYYKKMGFTLLGHWENSWFNFDNYVFTKLIQEPKEENYLK